MAKHIFLVTFFVALILFIAHTNASKDEKEEIPESCHKQLKSLNLKHCEKFLMKRMQKDEDEDDDNVIKMRGVNYIRNREEGLKENCCAQLSEVNFLDCRCEALQKIGDNLSDKCDKKEMEEMERELKILPLRCGITPPLGCDLSFDN